MVDFVPKMFDFAAGAPRATVRAVLKMMDSIPKTMDFALNMMDYVLKMMDSALKKRRRWASSANKMLIL